MTAQSATPTSLVNCNIKNKLEVWTSGLRSLCELAKSDFAGIKAMKMMRTTIETATTMVAILVTFLSVAVVIVGSIAITMDAGLSWQSFFEKSTAIDIKVQNQPTG